MADEETEERAQGDERHDVLVDDLADASDYWLSITDAARVTRRQEITIRRWIAVGELPVRRQRMGHNKRTRHVRASDLARITPIIDPTAGITGAPANVDLMSIPQHQAQLYQGQQEHEQAIGLLQAQLAELDQEMSDQSKQQRQEITQLRQDLATAGQRLAEQLERTTKCWDEQLVQQRQTLETTWQIARTLLEKNDAELAQRLEAAITQMTRHLETVQTTADQAQSMMRQQFAEQQQQTRVEIQGVADQLASLQRRMEDMAQAVQQQAEHMQQSIQAIQSALADLMQQMQARQAQDARVELRLAALELQRRRGSQTMAHRRRVRNTLPPSKQRQ
jgi:chromosome segregation ATPase